MRKATAKHCRTRPGPMYVVQPSIPFSATTQELIIQTQGLRGIAAVFVMCSHLTLCFARWIVPPNFGEDKGSALMQRPIFRLVGQGPAWVACFFILSGFVNALKPVKLARAGNTETALSNLAVSSFRRSFRLFLPATTATIISWFITQLGAYETARQTDAYWMYSTSPAKSASWWDAIGDLARAIQTTWCYWPNNPYDQPQWALLYLLQGSMFVFTALLVTINLTPRFRMASLALLCVWSISWGSRLADRTLHNLSFGRVTDICTSSLWLQRFCGRPAGRIQSDGLPLPALTAVALTRTTSRFYQSRPYVLSGRFPGSSAMVALPHESPPQSRSRKRRHRPLLARCWRSIARCYHHLLATIASSAEPQVVLVARQDQLSAIPPPWHFYSHGARVVIDGEPVAHPDQRR